VIALVEPARDGGSVEAQRPQLPARMVLVATSVRLALNSMKG
jgi:hypothetical protein